MTMKIGTRLALTFSAVLVLLLAICVTVSTQMSRMNENTRSIVDNHTAKIDLANQMKEGAYFVALLGYRSLDERTPEAQQADLEKLRGQVAKNTATYQY